MALAKGHPKVGWAWAPIGFAMATPWTNLPQGIGIVLGWAPIGFAALNSTLVIPNFV